MSAFMKTTSQFRLLARGRIEKELCWIPGFLRTP
jgi:hypothetical protein